MSAAETPATFDPAEPWQQMPGESGRWYVRFDRFRTMPSASRSARAVYLDEWRARHTPDAAQARQDGQESPSAAADGSGAMGRETERSGAADIVVPKTLPGAWQDAVRRWRWHERADAWDRVQSERESAERLAAAAEMRERRVTLLRGLLGKASQALIELPTRAVFDRDGNLVAPGPRWNDVTRAVYVAVRELRAEYDEEPRQRHELSGPDGQPVPYGMTLIIGDKEVRLDNAGDIVSDGPDVSGAESGDEDGDTFAL